MNKRTKTILSLVALVAVVAVFVGVYLATRPETVAGEKRITVELVGKDSARTVELDQRTRSTSARRSRARA